MTRFGGRLTYLMGSTFLAGTAIFAAAPAAAQVTTETTTEAEAVTPAAPAINRIDVVGNQRFEPSTVISYQGLRVGQVYTQQAADAALKQLYATELFANASIRYDSGVVTIQVEENPVINRILVEGNKSIKDDKILPEIKLAPRQIYTRSKVRADVARIIELYKRKGRFAATVEPQAVQLDQNRVDIVFELNEGPKSKVRKIIVIGNEAFDDGKLHSQMLTKQAKWFRIFGSGTTYDPDRLAYDQQKLRQFYLTEGYADMRVVSAVAELTDNKQDFIITYVIEEGDRYKFGDVTVESDIRDLRPQLLRGLVPMKEGDWYDAKAVEDTVERLTENAGLFGYAFAEVRPEFKRNKEALTMDVTFNVAQTPRVYIEDVAIDGNTDTRDKVIRREFRVVEGDAFNSFAIRRTEDRVKSLGYFQEDLEVGQSPGSTSDRIRLETAVEEGNTGELQLSAGFSSIERFLFQGSIKKRNFRGLGQELRASASYSSYSKSFEVGFTEPYMFNKSIALSGDIFRRDYNSFNYLGNERQTTYQRVSTGFQIRTGLPISEFFYLSGRYGLSYDEVSLNDDRFFTIDNAGSRTCSPLIAGRYLCDALGDRLTSAIGASLIYDTRDNRYRPSRGHNVSLNLDVAGLGGDVRYIKTQLSAGKYFNIGSGFIFSVRGEGGYIHPLENRGGVGIDDVRLTDRFFLGEPQFRGFGIRGVGPRILRSQASLSAENPGDFELVTDRDQQFDDALGGKAYYLGHLELQIPLGSGASELGLRPSIFADVGSLFSVTQPQLTTITNTFTDTDGNVKALCNDGAGNFSFASQREQVDDEGEGTGVFSGAYSSCPTGSSFIGPFNEQFLGGSAKPRLTVGIGVDWNSPFGPFRINLATDILSQEGDDPKLFSFNVGTSFQ